MKKLITLLLALLLSFSLTGCALLEAVAEVVLQEAVDYLEESNGDSSDNSDNSDNNEDTLNGELPLNEDGSYDSKEDVALYIWLYGELPDNYLTKKEAQNLGWSGGSLEDYAPGCCIGGSHFGNYEGILPEDQEYTECDIDTIGRNSRGAKRIVFADSEHIYYTDDHYESFTQITFTDDYQMIEEAVG